MKTKEKTISPSKHPLPNSDNLKEDWVECTLADVVTYSKGKKPKNLNKAETKEYNIPYINIKAFEKGIFENFTDGFKCNLCNDGDLLMVWDGARAGLTGKAKKGAIGSTLMKIEPVDGIDKEYLYYFLLSLYTIINTNPRGVGIPHVEPRLLWNSKFLILNSSFQRAIVKKIEQLFSSLDSGIADLKKAQEQLKIYRQAVLKKAFPREKKIEISKLVNNLSQGWSPKCINQKSKDNSQWAVIKTSAVQAGKFVELENKILPDNLEPREQHEIEKGDILITRAGPRVRVGICCLVRKTRPKLINSDKVYRLKLNQDLIDGEYFEYALNSPKALSDIEKMKSGSSDSGLNLTQKVFLKLQIPYTSKAEQTEIVRQIESRLSVCDKVEQSITESLEKAKALQQSILKKAFEGKLLSEEEIAECKKAPDYEPASVLLEKIKAEKQKNIKTKKKK